MGTFPDPPLLKSSPEEFSVHARSRSWPHRNRYPRDSACNKASAWPRAPIGIEIALSSKGNSRARLARASLPPPKHDTTSPIRLRNVILSVPETVRPRRDRNPGYPLFTVLCTLCFLIISDHFSGLMLVSLVMRSICYTIGRILGNMKMSLICGAIKGINDNNEFI